MSKYSKSTPGIYPAGGPEMGADAVAALAVKGKMEKTIAHKEGPTSLSGMIGTAPAMQRVFEQVCKAARTDATVLITGESGTGKELAGHALHNLNGRCDGPFVPVNCGAIPDSLVESQLFGHVKGTFTGAVRNHAGYFSQAHGGTLFLDEIGDLSLHSQVKLLRVLDDKTFHPLGGQKLLTADVRIVAATHRNLGHRVRSEQFREDLFYRLNVLSIELPPLRQRREDIPVLLDHFLRRFGRIHQRPGCRPTPGTLDMLCRYSYPGNIRELKHLVERGVVNTDDGWITREHLGFSDTQAGLMQNEAREDIRPQGRTLLTALKSIPTLRADGRHVPWYRTLRDSAVLTVIYAFLMDTRAQQFSRSQFADALRAGSESGKNKYKTAGDYLKRLHQAEILNKNSEKANKARYWLSPAIMHRGP